MQFLTRLLPFSFFLLGGCTGPESPPEPQVPLLGFTVDGRLEDKAIDEASGLARSQRRPGTFWVINDSGKETVHAILADGARREGFELGSAKNRDWEDLAAFTLDGEPCLLVADIGDNDAKRGKRTLYVVREPADGDHRAKVDWEIDYEYPDGPRDAESAAVDVENERVLILSKRDIPPVLYEVPLRPSDDGKVTARWLGTVTSLEHPTRRDVEFAPRTKNWHWQPTAMDISADNRAAVILTYRYLYYFLRKPDQGWYEALNSTPIRVGLGNFRNAEAAAFADDARTVIVTGEDVHARVLRIDLGLSGNLESAVLDGDHPDAIAATDKREASISQTEPVGRIDDDQ